MKELESSAVEFLETWRLSNDALVERSDRAVLREHAYGVFILHVLLELQRRSLHLERGYSSLHDYCMRRWHFSRTKTFRYLGVARAMDRYPLLRELLVHRKLTISAAACLASVLTPDNNAELLTRASGRAYAEVDALAASKKSAPVIRDRIRRVGVMRRRKTSSRSEGLFGSVAPADSATEATPSFISEATVSSGAVSMVPAGQGATRSSGPASTVPAGPEATKVVGSDTRLPSEPEAIGSSGSEATSSSSQDPSGSPLEQGAAGYDQPKQLAGRAEPISDSSATGDSASQAGSLAAGVPEDSATPEEEIFQIEFGAPPSFIEKFERVQSLCSRAFGFASVLEKTMDEYLERHDPARREARRRKRLMKTAAQHDCTPKASKKRAPSDPCKPATDAAGVVRARSAAIGTEAKARETATTGGGATGTAKPGTAASRASETGTATHGTAMPQSGVTGTATPGTTKPRTGVTGIVAPGTAMPRTGVTGTVAPGTTKPRTGETGSPQISNVTKLRKRSRHVPVAIRDAVFLEAEMQCCYVSPDGVRCTETVRLEFDHARPFALGGEHSIANGRVYCAAHNRFQAERTFGPRPSGNTGRPATRREH